MAGKSLLARKVKSGELAEVCERRFVVPVCRGLRGAVDGRHHPLAVDSDLSSPPIVSSSARPLFDNRNALVSATGFYKFAVSAIEGCVGVTQIFAAIVEGLRRAPMVHLNRRIGHAENKTVHLDEASLAVFDSAMDSVEPLDAAADLTVSRPLQGSHAVVFAGINSSKLPLSQRHQTLCGIFGVNHELIL